MAPTSPGRSASSRALSSAPTSLSSRQRFPKGADSLVDSLHAAGIEVSHAVTFASMTFVPGTQGTRLVQVRALGVGAPFYGKIETDPAGRWPLLQQGRNALVDPSLLIALDAHVGDSLALGYARFAIIGTLKNVPGDVGVASALGPRVYIPEQHLEETHLLGFGSRAEYEVLLKLPPTVDPAKLVSAHKDAFEQWRVRARTVQDTERSLTEGMERLERFLGVVGLVALLLGGIGVASAIYSYIRERIDSVAVLRCMGATAGQVVGVYLIESIALGLIGATLGVALGLGVQLILPLVLGDFIPVDVSVRPEPLAIVSGLATGVIASALFTLIPVLSVRRVAPLQVLRRDATPAARPSLFGDWARIAVIIALAAGTVALAIARTGRVRDGLGMSTGVAIALAALALSATGITWVARRVTRRGWPFVVRQGIANLFRPANQTRTVVLALGFGAFLVSTLYLVEHNLLRQLALSSVASQANLALFDIQQDQEARVDSLVRDAKVTPMRVEPIVPMRIASINHTPAYEWGKTHTQWAARREYRSSFRDTLVASEKLVGGKWFPGGADTAGIPGISVERDLANELGIILGDTVVWDVQGVLVPTRLTSLRQVSWARFEPNFFVLFEPRALRDAPKTYVMLARVPDDALRARIQRRVVEQFPNVSSLDLTAIQNAVERILSRISLAIRFMALFSVATGILVLVSAIAASRRQRLREGVLLKTLGATRAQVGRIMVAEYAVLGTLGALAGILLSVGGAWAVMHYIFEGPFVPTVLPLATLAAGLVAITVAVGLSGSRDVFAATPMAALQES